MTLQLKPLFLAALLAVPGAAFAQEADDTATPTEEQPAGDPADGLALSTDAQPGEPQVGEQYLVETFGDWALRCLKTDGGEDPCQLYQLLLDGDGNAVAEMTIFKLPEGSRAVAGSTIVAPLETLLTENVKLVVDNGREATYPFSFCTTAGCVARVGFVAEEVAAFKRGASATLTIVPAGAPDQAVALTVSLSGFTAGFDALASREN